MATHDTRRAVFRTLAAKRGAVELARELGVSKSYVSQLASGKVPFTEKTARKFELKLGIAQGYFDGGPAHGQTVRDVVVPYATSQLASQVIRAVGEALDKAKVQLAPQRFAETVAMAYEHCAPTGQVDLDYINRLVRLLA